MPATSNRGVPGFEVPLEILRLIAQGLTNAAIAERLGGWCQTPVPRAVRMSLEKRACESPSPALRTTSATDLVPENADFAQANRDVMKNTPGS